MKRILLWLLAYTTVTLNVVAQDWKWFHTGNTTLPTNNILSFAVSDSGKVYIASRSGLVAFDGNTWQRMNIGTMFDPELLRVWTDRDSLWVGTQYGGLWGYADGIWKDYDPNLFGNGMVGFGIDSRDSVYCLSSSGDFQRWNGTDLEDIFDFFSQPNNLFVDRSDNIWLLSNNTGLERYKNGARTIWQGYYQPTEPQYLPSGSLFDMVQDSTGLYWIASDDGLIKFDGAHFELISTANSGIASNRLRCLAFDRHGKLWIGTWDAGICVWDGLNWKNYNQVNSPLTSPIINDIAIDTANRIWIANGYNRFISPNQGQGIFVLDESVDLSQGRLPAAPDSLSARVISVNEVMLHWKDRSDNETGFTLERAEGSTAAFQPVKFLTTNASGFTDLTVVTNTVYYYRIRAVNSKGGSAYSDTIEVQPKYCTVNKADYGAYAIATKVFFGTIRNQPFNCRNGYYDYLDQSTRLFKGQTLMLTVAFNRCNITSDPLICGSVYIDWNSDGDFDDLNELVFTNTNIDGEGEFSIPVTVPDDVIAGTITRLRIRSNDDVYQGAAAVPPCGYAEETQDYTLYIIEPPLIDRPGPLSFTNITSKSQQVQWADNAGAETAYFLDRSADSLTFTRIATLPSNANTYEDTLLQPDTRYYYRVTVRSATDSLAGEVAGSNTLSADLIRQWHGDLTTDNAFNVGAYWGDFNKDGKADIYVSGIDRLYVNQNNVLNNSQLTFMYSATVAWGDFDNDGDDDLYVGDYLYGGGGGNATLYENNGNGAFAAMPGAITPDGRVNNAVWTDYNKDGFLDLYVSYIDLGYGKLYRNNKNKTFSLARKFDDARGYASFADYDSDGDDDLVLMGAGKGAVFNRQDSTFTSDVTSTLTSYNEYARGISWADYDNDGDLDLFVPNQMENAFSSLYINNGGGYFMRDNFRFRIVNGEAYGSAWADYDNDGFQDLFVSRYHQTNMLLRNKQGSFEEVPRSLYQHEDFSSFPYDKMPSLGCAWADYDRDGFLDIFVAISNGFLSRLYRNGGNRYNWISISLKGVFSNANGIGARVRIKVNGKWQYRWVESGSGYSAHNSFPVEFGLGASTMIDSMIIRWPSGIVQIKTGIAANQFLTITEESTVTAVDDVPELLTKIYPNPAFDRVYIELDRNRPITTYSANIYDVNGKIRQVALKHLSSNRYSIGLEGLSPGVYWLEIKEKDVVVRKKIMVMN